jgi:hypothetical protein
MGRSCWIRSLYDGGYWFGGGAGVRGQGGFDVFERGYAADGGGAGEGVAGEAEGDEGAGFGGEGVVVQQQHVVEQGALLRLLL